MKTIRNTTESFYEGLSEFYKGKFDPAKYVVIGLRIAPQNCEYEKVAIIKALEPKRGEPESFPYPYNRIDITEYCTERGLVFRPLSHDKNDIIDNFNEIMGTELNSQDFYLDRKEDRLVMNFSESLVFKGELTIAIF